MGIETCQVRVKVYKDGDRFLALIRNGWWMAYGKTCKEAIKRVKKRFEQETGYPLLKQGGG